MRDEFRHDRQIGPNGKGARTALDENGFIREFLPVVGTDGFAEGFFSEHPSREKFPWVDDLHRLNREGLAATATFCGVGVVKCEPFTLKSVLIIELGAFKIGNTLRIDEELDPVDILCLVPLMGSIESQNIRESRASARAYTNAQADLRFIFFGEEPFHF